MATGYPLPDWDSLAARGDDDIPLLDTALLIARDEYPDLEPADYAETLRVYADRLRPTLPGGSAPPSRSPRRRG